MQLSASSNFYGNYHQHSPLNLFLLNRFIYVLCRPLWQLFQVRLAPAVLCDELSNKEPHRQLDVGNVMTSGSLDGLMVSFLAWNAMGVGSNPSLGAIFPIFITARKTATNKT